MHIERIHKMIEKLTECALCEIEKGIECVNTEEMGEVIDMIKDLSEAEYKSLISKEMKKYKEEEEAEEKYMLRMLKDEYKDEYKEMKERYGDEADRRFYDSWRHADGSFARKGTGEYRPKSYYRRRGYAEPMYHMPLNMFHDYSPEELRDMDRASRNVMYYTPMSGNMSTNTSSANTDSSGNVRGYSDGYADGMKDGRKSGESRYDKARRGYEETKEKHKGNAPEDKQITMREAEKMLNVVFDEIDEMLEDAPQELKNMVKTKGMTRFQKIQ